MNAKIQLDSMEKAGIFGGALAALLLPDGLQAYGTGLLIFLFLAKAVVGGTLGMLSTDLYKWAKGRILEKLNKK